MSKRYSRDRSPLSPARYERTAGHSRSAKSPISIAKPYSSDSYKGLNSYRSKSFDKYSDRKYAKRDNGYKELRNSKYDDSHWQPKGDYKLDGGRKHDDYKYSYKKPAKSDRSKYDKLDYKNDYKRPLTRESSPKYGRNSYKDDYKKLEKSSYSKKSDDYKYKDYTTVDSFKSSDSRYKDLYYYKDVSPRPYKDSHKKRQYSSPDRFSHNSSKDIFAKHSDRHRDRSPYKVVSLYPDKRYDDILPTKSYDKFDYKDKFYDDNFNSKFSSKDLKRSFKDVGSSGKGTLDLRRISAPSGFDSFLFPDEYAARSNSSYERYVIGDSVVYGSPGHQPEDLYVPNNRASQFNDFPSLLPARSNNSRYSVTPPRFNRSSESFQRSSRLSPLRSRRLLPPLRSNSKSSAIGNRRLPLSSRRNRDDYGRARRRSESLKTPASLTRPSRSSLDDGFGSSRSKSRNSRPASAPKPLLSIRLPASSIPRASRMQIDHTVSIRDQAAPRERRGFGRRLDGRLGTGDSARTRERPQKSNDLRLWIESRKTVNRRVAKIFPTKSKQSRPENLSAIANRVRLLEARKRALENEGRSRRIGTKRTTDASRSKSTRTSARAAGHNSKARASRKASKSPPPKKPAKKTLTERAGRRRAVVSSKSAKSTATKRTASGSGKVSKSSTKSSSSKSRRSPARAKRRTPLSKKKH